MRKLLFLSHRIPYPPNKGDKIRSFHILKHLASQFDIFLGCFYEDAAEARHIEALRPYCSDLLALQIAPAQKFLRAAKGLSLGTSMSEAVYADRRMSAWVRKTLEEQKIADVFVFCSAMTPYLTGHASGRTLIFDFVDVDSAKWDAYAASAKPPLGWCFSVEKRRVGTLEAAAAAVGDNIVLASHAEAELLRRLLPRSKSSIRVVENGVDADEFDPAVACANPFEGTALPIVFTGAMDYRPNIDAVEWFARNVFPAIRREFASAQFWIVGYRPAASVRRLGRDPGVHVTGEVFDVRPFLRHGACVVSPLRIARGVQNKVLEAMAMGKPAVVTPAALEGLGAGHGREVLVAAGAEGFARAVMEVLSGKWQGLGSAARAYVRRHHDWTTTLQAIDRLFGEDVETNSPERELAAVSAGSQ